MNDNIWFIYFPLSGLLFVSKNRFIYYDVGRSWEKFNKYFKYTRSAYMSTVRSNSKILLRYALHILNLYFKFYILYSS